MAGAHCSYINSPFSPKKPIIISLSSISIPARPNPRRRKNHLRQKLLKTPTKPYLNPLLAEPPPPDMIIPVEAPGKEHFEQELVEHQEATISQENADVGGVITGELGKFWIFKLGVYLVGAFVIQTICAVWLFGSDYIDHEEGRGKENPSLVLSGKSGLGNGESGYLGLPNLEEKLVEIQAMARDVRESERLKSEGNEEGNEGVFRTGIEKEVDSKLFKLQKKLQDSVKKMPDFPVSDKNLEGKAKIEPLMIKKKYKFRGPSGNLGDKPKGFSAPKGYRVSGSHNGMLAVDDESFSSVDQVSGNSRATVALPSEKRVQTPRRKLGKAKAPAKPEKESRSALLADRGGASQESSLEGPSLESKRTTRKVKGEQSEDSIGQWWLSLPYVLVVLMHRGDDGEGPSGLFTLKTDPYGHDEGDSSHIVGFEDRGDATNFCYVLESFFEDLGNFSADIVPLSRKELEEEVRSHGRKVVVVKKGQLKLYAGQPLPEVEMMLRSFFE